MSDAAEITIEFTCADEDMIRERIEGIPFAAHAIRFEIIRIDIASIESGHDETLLPEYRREHGLNPDPAPPWPLNPHNGLTTYCARVRLTDMAGRAMTRSRIITIPFGNHDCGFSIDRVSSSRSIG